MTRRASLPLRPAHTRPLPHARTRPLPPRALPFHPAAAGVVPHSAGAGLRIGTNELTRWGALPAEMDSLAHLITRALTTDPTAVAKDTAEWRAKFGELHYIR